MTGVRIILYFWPL